MPRRSPTSSATSRLARDQAFRDDTAPDRRDRPASRLVHLAHLPPRAARHAELSRPLPPAVAARLSGPLWSHQAEAIDLARAGRSVVVATGTASGKSLCYQLPMAEAAVAAVRPGTGLVLFPTKALAHDQLRALTELGFPGVVGGAYDGDASPEERTWIRKHASVVLTNPEMLHSGLLPHHERWATFLGRLQYVVVDELHTFRGVFGSHVAQLLRRLRRLAAHHGAHPVFICCSATIGEPQRLASAITGVEVTPVIDDGSPRGPRTIALWQPPLLDAATGARASAHREAAAVAAGLIDAGHTTLGFTRSRRGVETVAADVRRRLPRSLAKRVRAYRGGYLPEERRAIEDELFAGHLAGIVATSALELGIDVGGLDAVVLDGFPGTIASFWQQVGRAGRGRDASAAVLVAGRRPARPVAGQPPRRAAHPVPRAGGREPGQPLRARPAPALRRPRAAAHPRRRPLVARRRSTTACAASCRPTSCSSATAVAEASRSPSGTASGGRRTAWACATPAARRCGSSTPAPSGPSVTSTGAGLPSRCTPARRTSTRVSTGGSWSSTSMRAWPPSNPTTAPPTRSPAATPARGSSRSTPSGPSARLDCSWAPPRSSTASSATSARRRSPARWSASEPLDLPPATLVTRAIWYVIEQSVVDASGIDRRCCPPRSTPSSTRPSASCRCSPSAIAGTSAGCRSPAHADTALPTIVIYDAMPGGAGVSELGYEAADRHLHATLESIEGCRCLEGCPSCVQSPKCGNGNDHLDKPAAVALLRTILNA